MNDSKLRLGVNIDHVATLRQARYRDDHQQPLAEPSPVRAALICEEAGAHSITAHLRADRRHVQDSDIQDLRERIATKLNLEMGNTPEILQIALATRPDDVCLVPENRAEITTEGGLDLVSQEAALRGTVAQLRDAGIRVSLFIDPDLPQIETASALGSEMVELHTGAFANAMGADQEAELERLIVAARAAHQAGLQVNAGHGINYENIAGILKIPHLTELNIGHSIVSRSVLDGIEAAVREMLQLMAGYDGGRPA